MAYLIKKGFEPHDAYKLLSDINQEDRYRMIHDIINWSAELFK